MVVFVQVRSSVPSTVFFSVSSRHEIWYDAIGRVSGAAVREPRVPKRTESAVDAYPAKARSALLPFAGGIRQTVAWATDEKSRSRRGFRRSRPRAARRRIAR